MVEPSNLSPRVVEWLVSGGPREPWKARGPQHVSWGTAIRLGEDVDQALLFLSREWRGELREAVDILRTAASAR
jgi:hypothetical protein